MRTKGILSTDWICCLAVFIIAATMWSACPLQAMALTRRGQEIRSASGDIPPEATKFFVSVPKDHSSDEMLNFILPGMALVWVGGAADVPRMRNNLPCRICDERDTSSKPQFCLAGTVQEMFQNISLMPWADTESFLLYRGGKVHILPFPSKKFDRGAIKLFHGDAIFVKTLWPPSMFEASLAQSPSRSSSR